MNRRTFFLGLAGLAGCTRDTRPRLNVYNWSAYIAPETIPDFEAEFGVRVRYATYESNEEMLAKVITGNSGWDIVFPTHNRLAADARQWPARAAAITTGCPASPTSTRAFARPPGTRSSMGRALHVERHRHRLQPQRSRRAPARWADLWSRASKAGSRCWTIPRTCSGACLKKLGILVQLDRPRRTARAPNGGHRAEASAARLPECRSARPTGRRRRAGGATLVHHGAAGDRRRAEPGVRLSGGGLSLLCDCAVILRESRRRAGAPVPRLSAARAGLGADRGIAPRPRRPMAPRGLCCRSGPQ